MKNIAPHIPRCIRNYYEPFLGGGSVLLYLLEQAEKGNIEIMGNIVCGDVNRALIICYEAIKTCPEKVIVAYESMCVAYETCWETTACKKHYCICMCKECYYHAVRIQFNVNLLRAHRGACENTEIAVQFLFLNATCYRGLYRESKSGAMNSCYWCRRSILLKSNEIRDAARLFQKYNVQFVASSYMDFLERIEAREPFGKLDFVLLDPPYVPVSHGDNISNVYHKNGFGDHDTESVLLWINRQKNTMAVTYCNHATEEVLAMVMGEEDEWPIVKTYDVRRSMKYSGASDSACELLVSNVQVR